jgi:hypothetical protein
LGFELLGFAGLFLLLASLLLPLPLLFSLRVSLLLLFHQGFHLLFSPLRNLLFPRAGLDLIFLFSAFLQLGLEDVPVLHDG